MPLQLHETIVDFLPHKHFDSQIILILLIRDRALCILTQSFQCLKRLYDALRYTVRGETYKFTLAVIRASIAYGSFQFHLYLVDLFAIIDLLSG